MRIRENTADLKNAPIEAAIDRLHRVALKLPFFAAREQAAQCFVLRRANTIGGQERTAAQKQRQARCQDANRTHDPPPAGYIIKA
jgi:hypothetical protein